MWESRRAPPMDRSTCRCAPAATFSVAPLAHASVPPLDSMKYFPLWTFRPPVVSAPPPPARVTVPPGPVKIALELSTQVPNGATEVEVGAHRLSWVSQIAEPV